MASILPRMLHLGLLLIKTHLMCSVWGEKFSYHSPVTNAKMINKQLTEECKLSLFNSFQELDLSAETLLKNVTPREDEWLKIAEQGLHPKAQYTKVTAKMS